MLKKHVNKLNSCQVCGLNENDLDSNTDAINVYLGSDFIIKEKNRTIFRTK